MVEFDCSQVCIRLAADHDRAALRSLFQESLLEGHVREDDTGADIEDLHGNYLSDEGQSGFWVADLDNLVIGMIGVRKTSDNVAEVRRLRVKSDYRRKGLGAILMEKAITFCQHHGYLKVVLDVRIERGPAISLFEKFGFVHTRTRDIDGRVMLDFYIDLYRDPKV